MKIATIVGARPQFIKAAVVSREIKNHPGIEEIIIHTGQHYDVEMSKVFFDELEIPEPDYNLEVGSHSHAVQTAMMLERIEKVLFEIKPDVVLVYGDTNSTLAGALTAVKIHIKTAHVEAGLRSFNDKMPEEINRKLTDSISNYLFVPTKHAMSLLQKEGLAERSMLVGDVMYDSLLHNLNLAKDKFRLSDITELSDYYLATVHRQENTDDEERLKNIFEAFSELDKPVLLPLHPRTKKLLNKVDYGDNVKIIDPVSPLKMVVLLNNCSAVLTDSGGLQKEAFLLKKPCITLRDETEWIETLNNNWNAAVGADKNKILKQCNNLNPGDWKNYYGDGKSAEKIINHLKEVLR